MNNGGSQSPKDPKSTNGSAKDQPKNPSQNGNNDSSKDSFKDKSKKGFEELGDKMKGTVKNIKDSELYSYAASNKEQTITYILLAIGIILLFVNSLLGGLIVGAVAGYHFSGPVAFYLRNLNKLFEGQDQLRYIVLTGLLVGLFIAAPGIFIGAVIVAVFKEVLFKKGPKDMGGVDQSLDSSQRDYDPKRK